MKLNLMAPINQLGYGVAGLNILKALQERCEVSLFPIGNIQVTNQQDADAIQNALDKAQRFSVDAPCIKLWHQNHMAEFVGKGEHIGFPIFELDTFSEVELHHLKSCDKIFVCSRWAQSVVRQQFGVSRDLVTCNRLPAGHKVEVVPLGVDTDIFRPAEPAQKGKTIFFNCGKWEVRKGHDILIEAFKKVADKHHNAELWMMCTNPFNSLEEEAQWSQLYNHPQVRIIPRAETQQEVYNIMSQVDCGVFPSRGEGWNLELLELMACGKHVIATDYSAHTEFCTEDNSELVTIIETEPAFDNKWFFGQGNWAKIDDAVINTLQAKMEQFAESHKGEINEAGIETAKQFSWKNTSNKILEYV